MRSMRAFVVGGMLAACPAVAGAECASLEVLLAPDSKDGAPIRAEVPESQLRLLANAYERISGAARLRPRIGVCQAEVPNAAALPPSDRLGPNGAVLVTTGIMKLLGNDEAALATLLAHELAHLIEEHSVQTAGYARQVAGASLTAGVRTALESGSSSLGTLVAKQVFATHVAAFRRDLERKADATGYQLYMSARYDPRGATRALEKLREARGEGNQSYLSTHPGVSERIQLVTDIARDDVARVQRVEASRALDATDGPYRGSAEELLAAGKRRELSRLVADWLRAVPGSGAAHYYKGMLMLGQKAEAASAWEAFEKSVSLDPSHGPAWLELAKSLWATGYKAESVACAAAMQGMPELEELRQALPETHILLHGRAVTSPPNLWWAKDADGRKLITNDRQVLESRGLPAERIPPTWVPAAR
jgi:Zn-dependent protease with chaperone function